MTDDNDITLDHNGRALVPAAVMDAGAQEIASNVEAVCFALNRAVTISELAEIIGRQSKVIEEAVGVLTEQLRSRGLMMQRHGDDVQLVTRPEVAWAVQRATNPERPSRLSRPALETLAIIAYRQPITRANIEAIRGVNCEAVLDSLERRALIVECGRQDTPGQPRLFGTTLRFLQIVGLERIEDLPPLPEGISVPDLDDSVWLASEEILAAEPVA